MAVYFLTGKLGSGKSLAAVGRIRDYVNTGRRVATNLDLSLEHLCLSKVNRQCVTRLPDKPRLVDLELLGLGCREYDEKRFGLIVLDECGTWLNSRTWNDKERAALLDWMLHARKKRWDVVFIIQDLEACDKQIRGALCEHLVVCRRLDRLSVPYVGKLVWLATGGLVKLRPPQIHVGTVFYGDSQAGFKVDRWWYRGRELFEAYDTAQVFRDGSEFVGPELVDMRASYSLLSAWHLVGRYESHRDWRELLKGVGACLASLVLWLPVVLAVLGGAILLGRRPGRIAHQWGLLRRVPPDRRDVSRLVSPWPALPPRGA